MKAEIVPAKLTTLSVVHIKGERYLWIGENLLRYFAASKRTKP